MCLLDADAEPEMPVGGFRRHIESVGDDWEGTLSQCGMIQKTHWVRHEEAYWIIGEAWGGTLSQRGGGLRKHIKSVGEILLGTLSEWEASKGKLNQAWKWKSVRQTTKSYLIIIIIIIIIITSQDPLNLINVNITHNDLDKFSGFLACFSFQHNIAHGATILETNPRCPSALGTCALNNYNWEIF